MAERVEHGNASKDENDTRWCRRRRHRQGAGQGLRLKPRPAPPPARTRMFAEDVVDTSPKGRGGEV
jgi:hypothetical protein